MRLLLLPALILVILAGWQLIIKFEGKEPEVRFANLPTIIGSSQTLSFSVTDSNSGLRKIWVGILQGGKETVLLEKEFFKKGFLGTGDMNEASIDIALEPKKLGISDGEAILRLSVRDHSWRKWWHGNVAYSEQTIIIDTKPAQIEVLSHSHNVTQGGAGLRAPFKVVDLRTEWHGRCLGGLLGRRRCRGISRPRRRPRRCSSGNRPDHWHLVAARRLNAPSR